MKMTPEQRLASVRNLARRLRKKYDLTPPVDLEALAEKEHIGIRHVSVPGIDGYADLTRRIAYLSDAQTYPPRRRFTLAHEIGHLEILWHTDIRGCIIDNPYVDSQKKQKIDLQEYEANTFASELLIPADWLREKAAQTADFETLLGDVVQQTGASTIACLYAMATALPGHVFCVTTEEAERPKIFRNADTFTWKAGGQDPIAFLGSICLDSQTFTRGSYQIRCYRLLPCPDPQWLRDAYWFCGNDLGALLQTCTERQPQRALHCLNRILSRLPDQHFVFFETQVGDQVAYCRTADCRIRPPRGVSGYDGLTAWADSSGMKRGELLLRDGKRLSWIRE